MTNTGYLYAFEDVSMHIFAINLTKDKERLRHVANQLSAARLSFERMPGIYGSALTLNERSVHYDESSAKWRQSRRLSSAEIGCSLSHLKVYREIIRRNLPAALILEDDVLLSTGLRSILTNLEDYLDPATASVILLSEAETYNEPSERLPGGWILKPFRAGYYASSYITTRAAAQIMLAELYPVNQVADPWMRLSRYRLVDIKAVTPALTRQDQEAFGSSTTEGIKNVLGESGFAIPLYKLRRLRAVLCDAVMPTVRRGRPRRLPAEPHPIDSLFC